MLQIKTIITVLNYSTYIIINITARPIGLSTILAICVLSQPSLLLLFYIYHIFCCNMFIFACPIIARMQCWLFALKISIFALKYKKKVNVKYVINRLWHEIFHIVPGTMYQPSSFTVMLDMGVLGWYQGRYGKYHVIIS